VLAFFKWFTFGTILFHSAMHTSIANITASFEFAMWAWITNGAVAFYFHVFTSVAVFTAIL
jgi:hypothetical protein